MQLEICDVQNGSHFITAALCYRLSTGVVLTMSRSFILKEFAPLNILGETVNHHLFGRVTY